MEISRNSHRNFNLIEWKALLEFVHFGKCSSIRQFAEIQPRIFIEWKVPLISVCMVRAFLIVFLITI